MVEFSTVVDEDFNSKFGLERVNIKVVSDIYYPVVFNAKCEGDKLISDIRYD